MTRAPAPRPCVSCPYRRDVPSGVWSAEEYEKLPAYDEAETGLQPLGAFHCHQQDGRLCAGWVAVHDMDESLALRMLASFGSISDEELDVVFDYSTDVELFASGTEAAAHGLRDLERPSVDAVKMLVRLERKLDKKEEDVTDRRVHASFPGLEEVVRYERAGAWYIELAAGRRKRVSVAEAAARAAELASMGGSVHLGLPGGQKFDLLVKAQDR